MKKRGWILAALLACAACFAAVLIIILTHAGSNPDARVTGSIIFRGGKAEFEEDLTEEEVDTLLAILDGKKGYSGFLFGVPSCGFDRDIAFVLDGTRYMVACDTCGTLQLSGMRYMDLSDDEIALIHRMFERRGGYFPCI